MCGVAGFVGNDPGKKVNKMLSIISHRGTDDRGIFENKMMALGNNRLTVIDVSPKGHQPMFDDEKSLCIVYNGEIYNFKRLKKILEKDYRFRSDSDTEVIIYAYKKWGRNCLKYLNGMFAFIIYDIKNNFLFGARDRLGEKPLKYFWDGKNFIFASEIKAILPVMDSKPQMDFNAINDYLILGYVPAPATGFKNIFKLPPASYFIFKDNKLKIYKYWDLDFSKKLKYSNEEWVDLLEERIEKAVTDRMVSDVPIGSFLSGGIDSSCVTAIMSKNSNKKIDTFSIGFTEKEFDETKYAKKVSELYDTNHHVQQINQKMFAEILSKSADYYDEPFADNSLIPSIILSKLASRKVTVSLSGDGGDENFAGYGRYGVVDFGKYFQKIPKSVRKSFLSSGATFAKNIFPNILTSRAETFAKTFDKPFYEKYLYYRSYFDDRERKNVNRLVKYNYDKNLSDLDNALKIDISCYLPEELLFKMDIASMSAGLEVRAPFLDYKLMELTAQMPDNLKIKNFDKKYIFKKMLLDKKILPREIVNRPKKGFNPPYKKWFKEEMEDFIKEVINFKKFRESEIFNSDDLGRYVDNYFTSSIDYSSNIFAIITLSNWIEKYF